jgi:hypothetical protein
MSKPLARPLAKASVWFIPTVFLGVKPRFVAPEKKAPKAPDAWTDVVPKSHKSSLVANPQVLDEWTEEAWYVNGKRNGLATWKNSKADVTIWVVFNNNIVQSIKYHKPGAKVCDYCWDTYYVLAEYSKGAFVSASTKCGCDEGGRHAEVSDLDLCRSAEYSWNHSYSSYQ